MKSVIMILVLSLVVSTANAQEPAEVWSLEECIEYAQKNNISIQQQQLSTENSSVQLNTARNSRLPDLNASLGSNMSFGRSTGSDNTIYNQTQIDGNLGVSASIPIFQGRKIHHEITEGKLNLQASLKDLERVREDVAVNVMTLYLTVLLDKELVAVAEQQLKLSTEQMERSRKRVENGKSPESELYESEALVANNAMSLTQRRNNLALSLLDLSQSLNRPSAEGFDIEVPLLDGLKLGSMATLKDPEQTYNYAEQNRPHVRAEELRLEGAMSSIKKAKAAFYPYISLSAGYGTSAYYVTKIDKALNAEFWSQLRNNSREYIGVSIGIPIFNRLATRNSVRTANLSMQNQQLALADTKLKLRKEIETAYYMANAAFKQYLASDKALESARIAFSYEQEKADAGRSTIFDYNDAKTRMEKAESDMVQSKYEFIFRSKILDYYNGEPLRL